MLLGFNVVEDIWFPSFEIPTVMEDKHDDESCEANEANEAKGQHRERDREKNREKHRARKRPRSELKVKKLPKEKKATTSRPRSVAKHIVNDGDNQGTKFVRQFTLFLTHLRCLFISRKKQQNQGRWCRYVNCERVKKKRGAKHSKKTKTGTLETHEANYLQPRLRFPMEKKMSWKVTI